MVVINGMETVLNPWRNTQICMPDTPWDSKSHIYGLLSAWIKYLNQCQVVKFQSTCNSDALRGNIPFM